MPQSLNRQNKHQRKVASRGDSQNKRAAKQDQNLTEQAGHQHQRDLQLIQQIWLIILKSFLIPSNAVQRFFRFITGFGFFLKLNLKGRALVLFVLWLVANQIWLFYRSIFDSQDN